MRILHSYYGFAAVLLTVLHSTSIFSAPVRTRGGECSYAVSARIRRSIARGDGIDVGDDMIGNPSGKIWLCKPEDGPTCTFFGPVLLNISIYLPEKTGISKRIQRKIIMDAAQKWAKVTKNLDFEWAPEGKDANIEVMFAFYDGPHGSIGSAGNPAPDEKGHSTFLRLDDAEDWDLDGQGSGYSLPWAALHEMGHAIGLGHSNEKINIMYSKIQNTPPFLGPGDIESIQRLYGASNSAPSIPPAGTPFVPPTGTPQQIGPGTDLRPIPSGFPSGFPPGIASSISKDVFDPIQAILRSAPTNGVIVNNSDLPIFGGKTFEETFGRRQSKRRKGKRKQKQEKEEVGKKLSDKNGKSGNKTKKKNTDSKKSKPSSKTKPDEKRKFANLRRI